MKTIINKKELIEALKNLNDNDAIVIDLDTDEAFNPDLYAMRIDVISGIKLEDGTEINEIRLTPVKP